MNSKLHAAFGSIDIYLFDQLLKGRFDQCETVLDVGCGNGRNIVWFLQNGFRVFGVDPDAGAISAVRDLSTQLAPGNSPANFVTTTAEQMPFPDASFDLVICNAVLHFARNKDHFDAMLHAIWRVLKPGGYLFARLASDVGIESLVKSVGDGRYLLPDGSIRYLVNHDILLHYTEDLGGELYETIKTSNVSNLRCMTTWCVKKK